MWPGAASGQGQPTWWHGAVGRVCLPSQHHGPALRRHLQRRLQAEKGEGCRMCSLHQCGHWEGSCGWDTHLPSTSLGAPGHSLSREFTGQLFQPA